MLGIVKSLEFAWKWNGIKSNALQHCNDVPIGLLWVELMPTGMLWGHGVIWKNHSILNRGVERMERVVSWKIQNLKIHANLRKNALQTLRVFAWIVSAWFDMFFHPRSAFSKTNGFNFIWKWLCFCFGHSSQSWASPLGSQTIALRQWAWVLVQA